MNEGKFSKDALLGYFQAYAWGIAIAIGVNLLVWPVSAEQECRDLLVTSLQHVSTLAHLTCKTYAKEIDKDEEVRLPRGAPIRRLIFVSEQEVRDLLVETIRGDFGALTLRLEEASFEILYTRWSMKDYSTIIQRVRGLQQVRSLNWSLLDPSDLHPPGPHHFFERAGAHRPPRPRRNQRPTPPPRKERSSCYVRRFPPR